MPRPPRSPLFPYTTSSDLTLGEVKNSVLPKGDRPEPPTRLVGERRVIAGADRILAPTPLEADHLERDRKSTRLNSSHTVISYAVFCLKKKKLNQSTTQHPS